MSTELGKAYVQIVPSADGIESKMTSLLSGGTASAGTAAGASIGKKLMGALAGAISVAAIGKAISASVSQGAALEQSLGGVETLFKDNADSVVKAASQAYRTAGLSANEYMETVTSFSASLLQSLGGDTAAAASVADMALIDMSDNANKMGSDMESIQNAYGGFAKQNYTMLDNLKLGYGGTAKEMQRLLSDAQKVSGVKYDIENLSDVYTAIHVIQEEMGIAGTTAKEASETIAGSMSAMKASFSDVIGNLALGEDITPSLNALAETSKIFLLDNLLPAIWNILKALPGGIVTFIRAALPSFTQAILGFVPQLQTGITTSFPLLLAQGESILKTMSDGIVASFPMMLETATSMILSYINYIIPMFPQILALGQQLLTNLISGIELMLPQLLASATLLIGGMLQNILSNLPAILSAGSNLIMSLIGGIKIIAPQVLTSIAEIIASLIRCIVNNFPAILAAGFDLLTNLIVGLGEAYPDLIIAAGKAVEIIWNTIKDIDWIALGKDIILGLINGIGAMDGALRNAATNIARAALDAMKGFFDIRSPSHRVEKEVGYQVPLGAVNGIKAKTKSAVDAMRNLGKGMMGSLNSSIASGVSFNGSLLRTPAYAGIPNATPTTNLYQTIHTHDSLSPSEMTREAEAFLTRSKWRLP